MSVDFVHNRSHIKTLAVIGASYLQRPLVKKAKEMGLRTVCFAWEEGAVCKEICDAFFPISIVEKEAILDVCQKEKIDGICTIASDVAAPTVAYVANKMGLIGNNYESALLANNKYLMRQVFLKAEILCPKFRYVTRNELLRDELNLEGLELPVIVKPTDRSGSVAVTKVEKHEDLALAIEHALNASFKHEAIVEEFIEGDEISVEFISNNGEHYPLQITDKVTTNAPHFVELEHHQPADLSKVMYYKIYALTAKALEALGITYGASHSEYKITKDGRIIIMEIGARMGGDFIGSDLVQMSTGYDFLKGVIDVAVRNFQKPVLKENKYAGVYFLCKETEYLLPIFRNWNNYEEIVVCNRIDLRLRRVACSGDRSGYFIYQSNQKFEINKEVMRQVVSYRANKILFNFLKSNDLKGTIILPANICQEVVDTLQYAGYDLQFVDIDKKTLCIDWKQVYSYVNDAIAIIAVHTYGIEDDFNEEFACVRRLNPNIVLIDDRCLCLPELEKPDSMGDLILYSTGAKKQVDLGIGGIGYVANGWKYEEIVVPNNDILTNATWAIDRDMILYQKERVLRHKLRLNAIYRGELPRSIQILPCSQWRFNIYVDNKTEILQAIFNAGLFASGHYAPLSKNSPVAKEIYGHVINLFNDFYFTEEQALEVCNIIKKNLKYKNNTQDD